MVPIMPKDFTLPFASKEQLTEDTFAFIFDRSQIQFDFFPGQYVRMFLDLAIPDERGSNRLFSVCSAPEERGSLMIVTRIIQSVFKKSLATLPIGSPVRFFGPAGRFVFEKEDTRPRVFLAGGIGITPYRSMILSAVRSNLSIPMTLFASYKTPEQRIFSNEFTALGNTHPWLHFLETITHAEESSAVWTGLTGRINAEMIQKNVADYKNAVFFTSGSSEMVEGTVAMLQSMGLPQEQIRKEVFTGY